MQFTKGLRQKFVLDFVDHCRVDFSHFCKYSIARINILPFVIPTKDYILWGYTFSLKVISVDCNRNLHNLVTYKFPHFTFLW